MKIAYVYDAIYPFVKGGVEWRIHEISRRLADRGHEIHWFGINWWNGKKTCIQNGVFLEGVCRSEELYLKGKRSTKEAMHFASKLLFAFNGHFDIIDCQAFPYFPCFSMKVHSLTQDVPLVITWHELWDNYWYAYLGRKGFFGQIVEKLVTRLTCWNVAVSERTKDQLARFRAIESVKLIPNGIDFQRIRSASASIHESDVIFVGRLTKEKNVNVLIEAIRLLKEQIPDIACVIVGDGPERNSLQTLVHSYNIDDNVEFTGFLENHDDVVSYQKSSKVFVLPSTREGFSIAALEANACGLPVVTVNHRMNAACDLACNGNGFVSELSGKAIGEKVLMALDKRRSLREKCIKYAEAFDWDGLSSLTDDFYRSVRENQNHSFV